MAASLLLGTLRISGQLALNQGDARSQKAEIVENENHSLLTPDSQLPTPDSSFLQIDEKAITKDCPCYSKVINCQIFLASSKVSLFLKG